MQHAPHTQQAPLELDQVSWQKVFDSCELPFRLTRKWCILQYVLKKLFLQPKPHLLEHKNLQKYMATWHKYTDFKKESLVL